MIAFGGEGGLSGRSVWLLSNLDWTAPWQPAHELALRLARANRVTFVETTGRRLPRPGDAPRLVRRLMRPSCATYDAGVRVVSPRALPLPSSQRAGRINAAIVLRALGDAPEPALVWALLPSPTLLALLDRLPEATLIYHCLLDFEALPHAPGDVARIEREVVERAALVVVDSTTLLDRRGWSGDRVALLPSGADAEPFVAARRDGVVAADVAALPRPLAGFAGSIDYRIDTELVAEAASQAPDWTFAFVGPADRLRRRVLGRVPNIHLLPARPHEQLPAALAGFDVGLIPYAAHAVRATTFPAKLFEYLAAGLPVVATPMPDLEPFSADVRIVDDAGGLAAALRHTDRRPAAALRRIALARENDWQHRELEWGRALRRAGVVAPT